MFSKNASFKKCMFSRKGFSKIKCFLKTLLPCKKENVFPQNLTIKYFLRKNVIFLNNKVNVVTFISKTFLRIVVVCGFVFKANPLESLNTL